jgi:hypothetical protein
MNSHCSSNKPNHYTNTCDKSELQNIDDTAAAAASSNGKIARALP